MKTQTFVGMLCLSVCLPALGEEPAQPAAPTVDPVPVETPAPVSDAPTAAPTSAPAAAPALTAPPTPPSAPPERGVTLQEQQQKKRKRHSRFAAGPGGALFVFTEVVSGLVTGGLVGAAYDESNGNGSDGAYLGALSGGVLLGSAAMAYQYYQPIGNGTSAMLALGAGVGFLGGLGVVDLMDRAADDDAGAAWLLLAATQAGILGTLVATLGVEDVSGADAALVGMTTTYATALSGLVLWMVASNTSRDISPAPVLLAPAGGMALGALLATQLELAPGRVLKLTALPLGVGLALLYLGGLADDDTIPPASALVGTVAAFTLTALFTAEPPPDELSAAPSSSGFFPAQVSLVPMLAPAGRRGEGIAAGPGVFATW